MKDIRPHRGHQSATVFDRLWNRYERHSTAATRLAGALFVIQMIHLYWLTTHVVALRLFGFSLFPLTRPWQIALALSDYTEVPALLSMTLVYLHALRARMSPKPVLFLLFVNLQWIHLFWITDEIILRTVILNPFLAWMAITIDYLELPVIADVLRSFVRNPAAGRGRQAVRALARSDTAP